MRTLVGTLRYILMIEPACFDQASRPCSTGLETGDASAGTGHTRPLTVSCPSVETNMCRRMLRASPYHAGRFGLNVAAGFVAADPRRRPAGGDGAACGLRQAARGLPGKIRAPPYTPTSRELESRRNRPLAYADSDSNAGTERSVISRVGRLMLVDRRPAPPPSGRLPSPSGS